MAFSNGVVAIAPHYEDAVFCCGAALSAHPGSTVLTVYSAVPPPGTPLTPWDTRCGFHDVQQAMAVRRAEEDRALALLQAQGRGLELLDPHYGGGAMAARLPGVIAAALTLLRPRVVLMPLGLSGSEHVMVGDAALAVMPLFGDAQWLAYEEVASRDEPGRVQSRLALLQQRQLSATPMEFGPPDGVLKARAMAQYESHQKGMGERLGLASADGRGPAKAPVDRLWRIAAAPPARTTVISA
ncbi:MAG: PIG-L family deacetylase [Bordetella sp.]|nr:PIG-L family deacetylase [Bordetella sp.]